MKKTMSLACLLHLALLFSSVSQDCSSADTISVTQPLQDPSFIVSSGQTFKLGFFSPENSSNRYVGITFNVPKMLVVWVANRDRPLTDSTGLLTVSEDGNLVLLNGKQDIVWSSYAPNSMPNSSAQLLDDGNLVLRDNSNNESVWESFQNPTDTFLRGMKIGGSGNGSIKYTSWRSQSDPSIRSFILGVDPTRTPEIFVWKRGVFHWRSGPWDGNTFIGVPVLRTVYLNRFSLVSGTTYITNEFVNASKLVHYKISFSGDVLEKLFDDKGEWDVIYSSVASECDVYGKCGPNGICDPKGLPICSCLKGFDPRDKEEWSKGNWTDGCFRKSLLQCQKNNSAGQAGKGDGYLQLKNVKVPDLSSTITTSSDECGNECLKNCSCSAYTFVVGLGCLHWAENMIDIQQFHMVASDLFIRVAHSELGMTKQTEKVIIATTVCVGCIFLAVSSYFLWNFLIKHKGKLWKRDLKFSGGLGKSKLEELPLYSYGTLAKATDSFHPRNKLGEGGFGPVYKGKLFTGQDIAVKRLSNSSSQGINEFMNEVTVISKLQHRNLVKLLGCSAEKDEKMLVYEYIPNKSLDAHLFDSRKQDLLDWNRRSTIIEGISRGLIYLHRDSRLRIIHRDLKASNILLDEELNPKISDFGLARIFGGKQDQANTNRVVGTYGYMAPEYAMGGKFSEKSDVYSFGVLLLEIVTGKKSTSFYDDEENLSLLGYAWKLWNENETVNMAFTQELGPSIEMEVQRCVQVGLLCVQDCPNDRPNMSNVLLMLNSEIVDLPLPKLPAYTATFSPSQGQDLCTPQGGHSVNGVTLTDVEGR